MGRCNLCTRGPWRSLASEAHKRASGQHSVRGTGQDAPLGCLAQCLAITEFAFTDVCKCVCACWCCSCSYIPLPCDDSLAVEKVHASLLAAMEQGEVPIAHVAAGDIANVLLRYAMSPLPLLYDPLPSVPSRSMVVHGPLPSVPARGMLRAVHWSTLPGLPRVLFLSGVDPCRSLSSQAASTRSHLCSIASLRLLRIVGNTRHR